MSALCRHPRVGSVWITHIYFKDGMIHGDAWDDSQAGSSYYPDDYRGEWTPMSFHYGSIVKYGQ